jgi:proton-dependent oligopeptide transporter, POT family
MIGTWFGHPKGVYLVAFTELWERFSYFGMAALLALYLSSPTASGGWGWTQSDAVLFYSFYAGLVFVMPVLGGWIANNHLGERRSIVIGAVLLTTGHLALGAAAFMPTIVERIAELNGQLVIVRSGVSLGRLWALDEIAPALAAAAARLGGTPEASSSLYRAALWIYVGSSGCFLSGLACIVAATGLFKPSIASIVGKLYPVGDARRDAGYAVFFTCIYIGAMFANFAAGGLGERAGWHYGFGAAAAGMLIGIGVYLWKQQKYLGNVGVVPDLSTSRDANPEPLTQVERDRLRAAILQGAFTTLYAAGFYQKGGLLTLYTRDHVDRTVFGIEVPATWFLSVSILVFIFATPALSAAYLRLARQGRNPSASYKLAAGLLLLGVAYVIIGNAEALRVESGQPSISALWLVAIYVLFGIADALVWPNQMALLTKLAPKRHSTLSVGVWYVTSGVGIWLAGIIGAVVERDGNLQVFLELAVLCLLAGGVVVLATPKMRRMMHGAEQTAAAVVPSNEVRYVRSTGVSVND